MCVRLKNVNKGEAHREFYMFCADRHQLYFKDTELVMVMWLSSSRILDSYIYNYFFLNMQLSFVFSLNNFVNRKWTDSQLAS